MPLFQLHGPCRLGVPSGGFGSIAAQLLQRNVLCSTPSHVLRVHVGTSGPEAAALRGLELALRNGLPN